MKREVKLFTEETMRDMGKRIQEERKNKGFKAIYFADIIGIGKDRLSRIENGRVACKIEYLYVMAQYLNISTVYILFGSTNNEINVEYNLKEKTNYIIIRRIVEIRISIEKEQFMKEDVIFAKFTPGQRSKWKFCKSP